MKKVENYKLTKNFFFESIYENGKSNINFGDIEIKKQKLHQYKRPISTKNIEINQIVVSNKVSFGKKGFQKTRPLCIFFPHRRDFDETKYMSFLIKDDELLEKYEIWQKKILKSHLIVNLCTMKSI